MKRINVDGLERLSKEQMKEIDGGCNVTCKDGYYACCTGDSCKCLNVMSIPPQNGCASGGEGASECMS